MDKLSIPMRVTSCEEIWDSFMFPTGEGGLRRRLDKAYKIRLSSSQYRLGDSLTPVEIKLTLTKPLLVSSTYHLDLQWVIANDENLPATVS